MKGTMWRGGFPSLNWSEQALSMREMCCQGLVAVEPVSRVGVMRKKECVQFESKYCVTLNKLFVLTCTSSPAEINELFLRREL